MIPVQEKQGKGGVPPHVSYLGTRRFIPQSPRTWHTIKHHSPTNKTPPQRKQPNPAPPILASVRTHSRINHGRSARSIEQRPRRRRPRRLPPRGRCRCRLDVKIVVVIIIPTSGSIRTVRHESLRRGRRHTDRVPPRRSVLVARLVGRIIRIRIRKKK